jgi:formate-dependent nitrite reductase membrane component NrfD
MCADMDTGTSRDWVWAGVLVVGMSITTVLGHFNHHDAAAVVALVTIVFLVVTIFTSRKRKQ